MATSGVYTFNLDSDGIVSAAYQLLGATAVGETPTAAELTDGRQMLNLMLKGWQNENIFIWLNRKATLFLADETAGYLLGPTGTNCTLTSGAVKTEIKTAADATDLTIVVDSITGISASDNIGVELDDGTVQWTTVDGAPSGYTVTLAAALTDDVAVDNHVYVYTSKIPRPMAIVEARRISADLQSTPLLPLSRNEYMALSNKTMTGIPSQFYYDPQLTDGAFYLWPAPNDVQITIEMTIAAPLMDFDAGDDNGELPPEYLDAVVMNLARRLGIKLGIPLPNDMKELAAETKFMATSNDDENTSVFFQPNGR